MPTPLTGIPILCPHCHLTVARSFRYGKHTCSRCGTRFEIRKRRSDFVWAKLQRIAAKLTGLYWYCDYHGFDSGSQSCECKDSTHKPRYANVMKMLSGIEMMLDTKPGWRLYHAEGERADVHALLELTGDREEIEEWKEEPGSGCAVFVEGQDDEAVIGELLFRQLLVSPSKRGIHIFRGMGGEGKEGAVRTATYIARLVRRLDRNIAYLVVLDGDATKWVSSQKEMASSNLFLLSKRQIETYLLDSKAIARVCNVPDPDVLKQLEHSKGSDKERLEHVVSDLGVRPTTQVKQLIARHLDVVPHDFVKMLEAIRHRQLSVQPG